MDQGSERIADPAELARVRRLALVVHIKSVVSAAALTALLVLL